MEYIEVSAKTVEDAISEAAIKLEVPSDKIEYEVITEGSTGFLGLIGSKPAVIKARKKFNLLDHTKDFLARLFKAMNVDVNSTVDYDEESRTMNIVFDGEDMGLLIGKRGQTLDSLQYIISLVVNKEVILISALKWTQRIIVREERQHLRILRRILPIR